MLQPLGGASATGTTIETAGACPFELAATTVNVDVSLMFVATTFDVLPATPGPVHVKLVGAPLVHAAVKVTAPPPFGKDAGEAVIAQPLGTSAVLTRTETDAG
jgi:hypothetical protein